MLANLRQQLETHNTAKLNGAPLTDTEFKVHLITWGYGTIFERVKTLRSKMHLVRDDSTSMPRVFNTSQ